MRRIAMTLMAALALTAGCGSDKSGDAAAPLATGGATAAPAAGNSDRAASLKIAIQGYTDAVLKGDLAGVTGYLDPQVCNDDDQGETAFAVAAIAKTANGATMRIKSVKMYGADRGGAGDYTLSANASDALRRLVKTSIQESPEGTWRFHDGEWYFAGGCEDASASPSPTS